jgi:dihydropyrimidinase
MKMGDRKPLRQAEASSATPLFNQIPNGLPGLETRLPLLFHSTTSSEVDARRTLSLQKFVALTSTNAAKIYGLDGVKGSIASEYDADLCMWNPEGDSRGLATITNDALHHDIDYTPV